uniref:C2H2-type domain-containing protein n=1 Tax=Panagrellus redivivus TaxID=6233 RepID=A0A7E4V8W6_PANRE
MALDLGYDPWGTSADSAFRDPLFGDDIRDDMLSHNLDMGSDFFDEMPHSSKTSSSSSENMYSPLSDNIYHNSASESELGTSSSPSSYLFSTDNDSSPFETDLFGLDGPDYSENNVDDRFDMWDREDYFCPTTSRSPTPKSDTPGPDFMPRVSLSPEPVVAVSPHPKVKELASPIPRAMTLSSPVPSVMATPSPKPSTPKPVVEPKSVAQTTLVTTSPVVQHVVIGNRRVINGPRVVRLPEHSPTAHPQPYHVPTGARFIRVTRVPAETPVYEAIRAAGIGNTQVKRFRAPEQPKILRPVTFAPHVVQQGVRHPAPQAHQPGARQMGPQVTHRKVVVLRRQDPNTGEMTETVALASPQHEAPRTQNLNFTVLNEQHEEDESDGDWDQDMPVLTREAPFKPEQLPPCVQPHPVIRPVFAPTPVFNNNPNEELQCRVCYKFMANRHALAKHMHIHETPRFKCAYCSRMFYDRTKVRRHQAVHSENLRISSRISDSDLPFPCIECGQSFTQLIHLQYHLRTHTTRKNLPPLESL